MNFQLVDHAEEAPQLTHVGRLAHLLYSLSLPRVSTDAAAGDYVAQKGHLLL